MWAYKRGDGGGVLINMRSHDQNFTVIKTNTLTFDALARNLQSGLLNKEQTKCGNHHFAKNQETLFIL